MGELIVPLFQDNVGQSLQIPTPQKICQIFWIWQMKADTSLGPLPKTTMEKPGIAG